MSFLSRTINATATQLLQNRLKLPKFQFSKPGAAPGINVEQLAQMPSGPNRVYVTCIDYSADQLQAVDILDIEDFLKCHRPEWSKVRWINVDGLTDMKVIRALAEKYELHPLAIEDMLHDGTRPKVESYPGNEEHHARLFLVARMISLIDKRLHCEQISFFLGAHTLITFQEDRGDVWDGVRERIYKDGSRLRQYDTSYLLYALIDAVVDQCFPVLEHFSEQLEDVENEVLQRTDPSVMRRIHDVKHEMLLLRREFRPMREMVNNLHRSEDPIFSDNARLFLRDVYDHSVEVIELMETYREVTIGLTETYMSCMSNRMNEVMKVLTIIATIFMPLSFVTGLFGMNFPHMPEFETSWSFPWLYPIGFWIICLLISGGMLVWFRKNRWI